MDAFAGFADGFGVTTSVISLVQLTNETIRAFQNARLNRTVVKTTVQRCLALRETLNRESKKTREGKQLSLSKDIESVVRTSLIEAKNIAQKWEDEKRGNFFRRALAKSKRAWRAKEDEEKLRQINDKLSQKSIDALPSMLEKMDVIMDKIESHNPAAREWEVNPRKPIVKLLGERPYMQGALGYVQPVSRSGRRLGKKRVDLAREDFEEQARIMYSLRKCEYVMCCEGGYWDDASKCGNLLLRMVESEKTLEYVISNRELQGNLLAQAIILNEIARALKACVNVDPHIVIQNLNPQSILMEATKSNPNCPFTIKICDFSTADTARESRSIYARAVDIWSAYKAPEKLNKNSKITTKVDVWSFGWLVYFIATGKHPPADIPQEMEPLDFLDLSGVNIHFANVIHQCLLLNPGERASCDLIERTLQAIVLQFAKKDYSSPIVVENPQMQTPPAVDTWEEVSSYDMAMAREPMSVPAGAWPPGRESGPGYSAPPSEFGDEDSLMFYFRNSTSPRVSTVSEDVHSPATRMYHSTKYTVTTDRRFSEAPFDPIEMSARRRSIPNRAMLMEKGEDELVKGNDLMTGKNGRRDERLAMQYFRKAVALGNPSAMNILAKLLMKNPQSDASREEAFQLLHKSAHMGHTGSMVSLGYFHETSRGVARRPSTAARWYKKAAEEGDAGGMCNYARCLERGFGVAKDVGESLRWYADAANQGNCRAMCQYGLSLEDINSAEAYDWFLKAANKNHARGLFLVAKCHEKGSSGRPKDIYLALDYYQKAADLNYPHALTRIGQMYENGEAGIGKNLVEAAEYYKSAMQLGNSQAAALHKRCREAMMGTGKKKAKKGFKGLLRGA